MPLNMDKERVIERLSWILNSPVSSPRYATKEFREEQFRFFENYVHFLQDNGFTTRILLKKGEKATEESQIKVGDLTPEGLKFYAFGVRKWREKYDRAKDKIRAINDFAFIEKKLKQFREQETK